MVTSWSQAGVSVLSNTYLQTDKADPHKLFKELKLHHKSLNSRLYTLDGQKKEMEEVGFGYKFMNECRKIYTGICDQ